MLTNNHVADGCSEDLVQQPGNQRARPKRNSAALWSFEPPHVRNHTVPTMRLFQIRQATTRAILWTGVAADEANALDAMAHEAGFRDAAHLPAKIRDGGLRAEMLKL